MPLFALVLNPIGLLIALLVMCVLIWAAKSLLSAFGIGDPIATVIYVIIVLIALAWLWQEIGGGTLLRL